MKSEGEGVQNKYSLIPETVMFIIAVLFSGLFLSGLLSYQAGVYLYKPYGIALKGGVILIFLVFAFLFLWFVRFHIEREFLPKSQKRKRLGLIFGGIGVLILPFYFYAPGQMYLYGFRKGVLREVDISGIREWAGRLKVPPETEIPKPWPEAVQKLNTPYVHTTAEAKEVRITWGGVFGHWGIVVGPVTMRIPESDHYHRILPGGAGMYVWEERQ